MKISLVMGALAAVNLACVMVHAAEPSSAAGAPSAEHKLYKIRPGDHISITVYGHEKLGVADAIVDATGEVRIAGVSEPIPAAGLSVADIRAMAESRYKKTGVEDPRVAVFGRVIESKGVKLVSSVPAVRLPEDPMRSDAKRK